MRCFMVFTDILFREISSIIKRIYCGIFSFNVYEYLNATTYELRINSSNRIFFPYSDKASIMHLCSLMLTDELITVKGKQSRLEFSSNHNLCTELAKPNSIEVTLKKIHLELTDTMAFNAYKMSIFEPRIKDHCKIEDINLFVGYYDIIYLRTMLEYGLIEKQRTYVINGYDSRSYKGKEIDEDSDSFRRARNKIGCCDSGC